MRRVEMTMTAENAWEVWRGWVADDVTDDDIRNEPGLLFENGELHSSGADSYAVTEIEEIEPSPAIAEAP